ncbi:Cd2+/Zn2+-exporting ATPase [Pilibacter termitis]|uniref:Cd2+/Zn2+-exporting ATPase n=1 Tax=Pilibacter termitis TaxID=263852 RepID=A0A1T4NVQ5_9ENTE|nr:heavy metal translocating P-type ATPase [Pilibacter termitis]SJZ83136.1 Cd2+/Zn2+-exporting ATPase [Pilibacter termitis]
MKNLVKNKERSAFLSTGLCLLFMVIGWSVERLGGSFYQIPYIFAILFGGWKQTSEGIVEIFEDKTLNVDLLMALASIGACAIGDWVEGAMLTFIFCLSGALEEYTTSKSKKEITSLMNLQPTVAKKIHSDGSIEEVEVSSLELQDKILVAKGENISVDGEILHGVTNVDESLLSGEAIPVEKSSGDSVYTGTMNLGNAITIVVTKKSEDTMFAKIVKLVDEAQNNPTKTASFIEKIENTYVKIVLCAVPLMILLTHFLFSWSWHDSFYRGMVLLVVASPCALVASATPATLATLSNLAKRGVLFKGGQALENLEGLRAISFDKTGTLTEGKPKVTNEWFLEEKRNIAPILLAMEEMSTHPIATAIVEYLSSETHTFTKLEVIEKAGFGLETEVDGAIYKIGKHAFDEKKTKIHPSLLENITRLKNEGKTVIFCSKNDELIAFLALLDTEKEESVLAVQYFNYHEIQTMMMTGDNEGVANHIAQKIGIQEVYANLLPEDKTILIQKQKERFAVNAMVGDGINDAPALATASIGVAMGEGSDIAMDVADVVLMKNDLGNLVVSHKLSKKMKKIIKQNICFSLTIICLLILSNFFQIITLPLGVLGHEGSTILVILNGLRMLRA